MGIQEEFDAAVENARTKVPGNIPGEDKLILYGLFKQSTVGDNPAARPGMFDPKGRAKWDAWDKQKGKSKETAMEEYVMKVESLMEKFPQTAA